MKTIIADYHKNRTICDFKYIIKIFLEDERICLAKMQRQFPNYIIRTSISDYQNVLGYGGSVPVNWNGKFIKLK